MAVCGRLLAIRGPKLAILPASDASNCVVLSRALRPGLTRPASLWRVRVRQHPHCQSGIPGPTELRLDNLQIKAVDDVIHVNVTQTARVPGISLPDDDVVEVDNASTIEISTDGNKLEDWTTSL